MEHLLTQERCAQFRSQLRYFGVIDEPYGLECLERSAALGHTPAAYVLAGLLLCSQEPDQDVRAVNLIRDVRDSSGDGIMECRIELVRFLYYNPPARIVVARLEPPQWITHHVHGLIKRRQRHFRVRTPYMGYVFKASDGLDAGSCTLCSLEFEGRLFCSLFRRMRNPRVPISSSIPLLSISLVRHLRSTN